MYENSPFLDFLIEISKQYAIEDKKSMITEERILQAMLRYALGKLDLVWPEQGKQQVGDEGMALRLKIKDAFPSGIHRADRRLAAYLKEQNCDDSPQAGQNFVAILVAASEKAGQRKLRCVTADILCEAILEAKPELIASLNGEGEMRQEPRKPASVQAAGAKQAMSELITRTQQMEQKLRESVFGQDYAIDTFVTGYFQAELRSISGTPSRKPKMTFLFAGPPGVGKTFLAETVAQVLQMPFCRFDMSEYSDKEANIEFAGSDKVYKNGKAGNVTSFVEANPHSVLLFDEIEKAHINVIHLFLQILDAGRLRDNFTDREVPFENTIIIFTTNAGKQLYEDSEVGNFSGVARKTILKALEQDKNPENGVPYFPQAICSRFASGNVVMFNRMEATHLRGIARKEITRHAVAIAQNTGIEFDLDPQLYSALLFAEGGLADARTISSRANALFDREFFELLRLIASDEKADAVQALQKVRIEVELPKDDPQLLSLFRPEMKPEILVCADDALVQTYMHSLNFCTVRRAENLDDAIQILKKRDIHMVLCDIFWDRMDNETYLSAADLRSGGRLLYRHVRQMYMDMPVYLLETEEAVFGSEEKMSFLRDGARGFIACRNEDADALRRHLEELCNTLHQQQSMLMLARANKVVSYDTAQTLSADGSEATILLRDFKLVVSLDPGDGDSVLSAVSRPDVRFEQVIGGKEAKEELRYFADYLRNPRRYLETGVRPPRGVLLYGPPGTGKTMLAKAMAGESDATFLVAEGNQFLKKYEGEGSEAVHKLFRTARKYAPAILFIDEIDAIAKERTGASGSESTLTAFLAEMDGFKNDATKPVFVLAATNFDVEPGGPKSLDPALMRRFDRRVLIDLPDRSERETYIRLKMSKNSMLQLSDDKIASIAVRSTGMSIAELESVIEMALRLSIRLGSGKVTDSVFDEAFETFRGGEVNKLDISRLERTARHESGHALLCWLEDTCPSYVTIVARGDHGGYMQYGDHEGKGVYTRKELLGRIRVSLAGRGAELVYYGDENGLTTGASSDLASATRTATRMICAYGMNSDFGLATMPMNGELPQNVRDEVNRMLRSQMDHTCQIIARNRAAIDAMVAALLEHDHLSGPDIERIFRENAVDKPNT